jgi:hypothetical protein
VSLAGVPLFRSGCARRFMSPLPSAGVWAGQNPLRRHPSRSHEDLAVGPRSTSISPAIRFASSDRLPLAILVGSAPGSGKSVLKDALAGIFDLPALHKDQLVHGRWRTLGRGLDLGEPAWSHSFGRWNSGPTVA